MWGEGIGWKRHMGGGLKPSEYRHIGGEGSKIAQKKKRHMIFERSLSYIHDQRLGFFFLTRVLYALAKLATKEGILSLS